MAKKNVRDEPLKPQVTENEQMSDIVLILDKMELLKDPTRFGILSIKEDTLDDPKVRQAVEDLAAGKKTDAVEEFLKQYEIVPRDKENQSINHQNQEEMAKKNETQQQAAQGDGTCTILNKLTLNIVNICQ